MNNFVVIMATIQIKLPPLVPKTQGTGYIESDDDTTRFTFDWNENIWSHYDIVKLDYAMTTLILGTNIDEGRELFPKSINLNKVSFKNFLEFMPPYDGSYLSVGKLITFLHITQNHFFDNEFKMISVLFIVKKLVGKAGLVYHRPKDIYDSLIYTFEQDGLI